VTVVTTVAPTVAATTTPTPTGSYLLYRTSVIARLWEFLRLCLLSLWCHEMSIAVKELLLHFMQTNAGTVVLPGL